MQYTLCDSRLPVRPRPIWPLSIFIIDMVISYEIYSEQLRKKQDRQTEKTWKAIKLHYNDYRLVINNVGCGCRNKRITH